MKITHTFSAQEMSFTERLVKNANKAKVWGNPIDDYCFVYENGPWISLLKSTQTLKGK